MKNCFCVLEINNFYSGPQSLDKFQKYQESINKNDIITLRYFFLMRKIAGMRMNR